jgi:hypothetical protein
MGERPKHIKRCSYFPRLTKKNHSAESCKNANYNCIAYAAGSTTIKWWPIFHKDAYWPPAAPNAETIDAFIKAFATLGYVECADGSFEQGIEKVAIYSKDGTHSGKPTHAARQINGQNKWASKLGDDYDIHHNQRAIGGGGYGEIVTFMQRPRN